MGRFDMATGGDGWRRAATGHVPNTNTHTHLRAGSRLLSGAGPQQGRRGFDHRQRSGAIGFRRRDRAGPARP